MTDPWEVAHRLRHITILNLLVITIAAFVAGLREVA